MPRAGHPCAAAMRPCGDTQAPLYLPRATDQDSARRRRRLCLEAGRHTGDRVFATVGVSNPGGLQQCDWAWKKPGDIPPGAPCTRAGLHTPQGELSLPWPPRRKWGAGGPRSMLTKELQPVPYGSPLEPGAPTLTQPAASPLLGLTSRSHAYGWAQDVP